MIKYGVALMATFGFYILASMLAPSAHSNIFSLLGFGVSYLMVACFMMFSLAAGWITVKG